jgi:hypothetical protein
MGELKDINIYKSKYLTEKEFNKAVDFCRQVLEDNFLSFLEYDYEDRYIFGNLEKLSNTVVDYESQERGD